MHQFIESESPEIYGWFMSKLDHAVEQGWLNTS
jgi:putative hydrolase of HD superfamily